jgi:hypothetical protein
MKICFISETLKTVVILILFSCSNNKKNADSMSIISISEKPVCSEFKCTGKYTGVEFNNQIEKNDVAHQYSNMMSKAVGDQLKKLYREGKYAKVDFNSIVMKTKGMGKGNNFVVYELEIPFQRVNNACEAMTAFDHSGGWNHLPDLAGRKQALIDGTKSSVLNKKLEISPLLVTPEGLQEYWIQWQHCEFQKHCYTNN